MGVQELKAQADDMPARFEAWPACRAIFTLPRRRAIPAWASTPQEPQRRDHRLGGADPSSTPKAATWSCASTRPAQAVSIISCYFPSGSSGEERQQAKFRFLAIEPHPHLMR
jgi:exodeoxyribonuclease-3